MVIKQVKDGYRIGELPQVYATYEEAKSQLDTYQSQYSTHVAGKIPPHRANRIRTLGDN